MLLKNLKGNLIGVGVVWIHNMNEYTFIIHGWMLKANELFAMANSYSFKVKRLTLWMSRVCSENDCILN